MVDYVRQQFEGLVAARGRRDSDTVAPLVEGICGLECVRGLTL